MTQNNILLISGAILPVIITVIIGYISGKRKDFNWQQAGDINKIVMLYALPLSIFSNMVMTPRHIVMTMGPVAVAIILALILSFVIPLLVARYLFRRDLALSTLQALAIGSPAVPFIWHRQRVADHRVQHHAKRLPATAGDDTDVGRHRR
jgi:malonate transporter